MPLQQVDFELPPARILSEDERGAVVKSAIDRLRSQANSSQHSAELTENDATSPDAPLVRLPASEAWVLFLVRMATRGPAADAGSMVLGAKQDIRQTLCDYVLDDFTARYVNRKCHMHLKS